MTKTDNGPLTVVILDDSSVMRRLLRELLTHWGYDVLGEAATVSEAAALCRLQEPRILLTTPLTPGNVEVSIAEAMGRVMGATRFLVARGTTAESIAEELQALLDTTPRES